MGYRHYDKHRIAPQFPFGFGLSYTTFGLRRLSLDKSEATPEDTVTLSVELTNTRSIAGAEVLQVYFHYPESPLERPLQALCAFHKIRLQPAETQVVQIPVPLKELRYYNPAMHHWVLEPGAVELRVGTSSQHLPLSTLLQVI